MKHLCTIREILSDEYVGKEFTASMHPIVTEIGKRCIELLDLNKEDLILNDSAINKGKIYYKNQTLLEFNIRINKTCINGCNRYTIKSIEVKNDMYDTKNIDDIVAQIEAKLTERKQIYDQAEKRRIKLMSKLMEFMPEDIFSRSEFFNDLLIIARLNQEYEKKVREEKLSK